MKKLTTILIAVVALASCSRKTLPPATTVTNDSKETIIHYVTKDSIVKVAGDSVRIHDSLPCPEVEYHKEVKSDKGNVTAKVDISKGKIDVDCKADSLQARITWLEKNMYSISSHSEVKQVPYEVKVPTPYTPKWHWWLHLLLLLLVGWTFRNPIVSLFKHFISKWN